jgi:hypothetical protein
MICRVIELTKGKHYGYVLQIKAWCPKNYSIRLIQFIPQ